MEQPEDVREEEWIRAIPLVLTILSMIILLLAVAAWTGQVPVWSGFGPYDSASSGPRAKTLWEWMDLLIVPVVLALGAAWINRAQKRTEIQLAEKARIQERRIADDRQSQMILEAYFDRMTDLLLGHNLRDSAVDDEARSIAWAITLAALRGLDGERKTQALLFLKEARLIFGANPVVQLLEVDLSCAVLSGIDLYEARLTGADLSKASLVDANLSAATLIRANLCQADLRGANLDEAKLSGARLTGALYNSATLWPIGFDPQAAGLVLID